MCRAVGLDVTFAFCFPCLGPRTFLPRREGRTGERPPPSHAPGGCGGGCGAGRGPGCGGSARGAWAEGQRPVHIVPHPGWVARVQGPGLPGRVEGRAHRVGAGRVVQGGRGSRCSEQSCCGALPGTGQSCRSTSGPRAHAAFSIEAFAAVGGQQRVCAWAGERRVSPWQVPEEFGGSRRLSEKFKGSVMRATCGTG